MKKKHHEAKEQKETKTWEVKEEEGGQQLRKTRRLAKRWNEMEKE